MSFSVNTNASALVALQNLNATASQLTETQNEVSTGLKVSSPKDNGAIWDIAQNQRASISSLDAVKDSLNRGTSVIDVALSAGQSVSDLLTQMKAKALAASDTSLDSVSRSALNADFTSLRDQITKVTENADFNGANLIKKGATNLTFLANASGTSLLTAKAQDLSLGGGVITVTATASFATATAANSYISVVSASITNVNNALAKLGTTSNEFSLETTAISNLQDTLTTGVGNLVNANLAKESAQLQALQTKQSLGVQALSIANQGPQALLSLFK